jgi:hypothetical protein
MDKYRKESALRFGVCLRKLLVKKYPYARITSVFLAEQYNLRANSSETISNETARKWLNGISLPSVHRFQVLQVWLGMDNEFVAKYTDIASDGTFLPNPSESLNSIDSIASIMSRSQLFDSKQIDFIKNTLLTVITK